MTEIPRPAPERAEGAASRSAARDVGTSTARASGVAGAPRSDRTERRAELQEEIDGLEATEREARSRRSELAGRIQDELISLERRERAVREEYAMRIEELESELRVAERRLGEARSLRDERIAELESDLERGRLRDREPLLERGRRAAPSEAYSSPRREPPARAGRDAPLVTAPARLVDEAGRVGRGFVLGYLEMVRSAADVAASLAEDLYARNRGDDPRSTSRTVGGSPSDTYSGLMGALDRVAEIPERAIDRFYATYKEPSGRDVPLERTPRG
jgi:hypothetical protein